MPDPYRILTSPLPLTGTLTRSQLSTFVTADVLVRRARAAGRRTSWTPPSLVGDLSAQVAVERELARQGLHRSSLDRDAYTERVRAYEAQAREDVAALLAAAGVEADLEAGVSDVDDAVRAARTAFVRLYEAGLIQQAERVVDLCPRCGTVVEGVDTDVADVDAVSLTVRFDRAGGGHVDVEMIAAELLPGVVAIAVPEGHEAAGDEATVPLTGRIVPVMEEPGIDRPEIVVPAHDPVALDTARRLGLTPVDVLDDEAVVRAAPLDGLARYAARQSASELLAADGALVATREAAELVGRCRRCGTVLLPRLGRHWFLAFGDLGATAADAVREGVTFSPDGARQVFLDAAARAGWWCLSHHGWAGQSVPVGRCTDCGGVDVGVDLAESCGKCMGTLVPEEAVLDPRFVGAIWPLADAGWPNDEAGPAREAPTSLLLVGRHGIARWALPIAALGLRLTGAVPFSCVAAVDAVAPFDTVEVAGADPAAVRVAALRGDYDLDAASEIVDALREPAGGDGDVDDLLPQYEQAFAAGAPAAALGPLAALARDGTRAGDRVRALAAPMLGT